MTFAGQGDAERPRRDGQDLFVKQLFVQKGSLFDRYIGDDMDEHLRDDFVEFPDVELDMTRTKVWTWDLEQANRKWYDCRRKKGITDAGACIEEGDNLRREHWRHQLQIEESGCEKPWYRYAKCFQRAERNWYLCRETEYDFQTCVINAETMRLVPETPKELRRIPMYSGSMIKDWLIYREWIKRRDNFLNNNPTYLSRSDINIMDTHQLYDFIKSGKEYPNEYSVPKPNSEYSFAPRWKEYIPKRDPLIQY